MLTFPDVKDEVRQTLKNLGKWNPLFLAFPFRMHPTEYKILTNQQFMKRDGKIYSLILLSAFLLKIYKSMEHQNLYGQIFNTFRSLNFLIMGIAVYFHHRNCDQLAKMLNELIKFEEWHVSFYRNLLKGQHFQQELRWVMIAVKGLRYSAFSIFATSAATLLNPRGPMSLLPAALLDKFDDLRATAKVTNWYEWIAIECLGRFLNFTISFLGWSTYYKFVVHCFCLVLMTTAFALQNTLRAVQRTFEISEDSTNLLDMGKVYRKIQVILLLYNSVCKNCVTPALVTILACAFIANTTIFITQLGQVSIFTWVVFSVNSATIFGILLIGCHCASNIFVISKEISRSEIWACKGMILGERSYRIQVVKQWKSFPIFKVFFFACNFFEGDTPLVILEFCINNLASFLLLK